MTGLPPAPLEDVRWEPPTPGSTWIRRQVVENMPEPLSPLFDELYLGEGLETVGEVMEAAMGVPQSLMDALLDRPLFATVNGYAYMRGNIKPRWWSLPVLVPAMLGVMATGVTNLLRNASIKYWHDDALPTYLATIERWKAVDPAGAADEHLLRGVRELARADARHWFAVALAVSAAKNSDVMLDRFLVVALPGRGLSSGLFLRGFPSPILDAATELEEIAERIRDSDELRALVAATPARDLPQALAKVLGGRPVLDGLRLYLEHYGHQIYNLDFVVPTLAEDPLPVLLSLKALVQQPGRNTVERQAEMARERERLVEETARSLDPLRRRLFLRVLRWAQGLAPNREEALFYIGSAWPTLRRLALELGRRLVATGSLDSPDDVFFLESGELLAASEARAAGQARPDLAQLARGRRELREVRKHLHPPAAVPPTWSFSWGPFDLSVLETQKRNVDEGPVLRGFAVSPGKVSAPASVVLSPADFDRMRPGTILVCPTTTPAWTPLFAQASGLVTDIGGVAAHGSILAREYGIPAVMGTGNGTQRITSGQVVSVDGDAGTVILPGGDIQGETTVAGPRPSLGRAAMGLALLAVGVLAATAWWRRRRGTEL